MLSHGVLLDGDTGKDWWVDNVLVSNEFSGLMGGDFSFQGRGQEAGGGGGVLVVVGGGGISIAVQSVSSPKVRRLIDASKQRFRDELISPVCIIKLSFSILLLFAAG